MLMLDHLGGFNERLGNYYVYGIDEVQIHSLIVVNKEIAEAFNWFL